MTRSTLETLLAEIGHEPLMLARFAKLQLARGQREQAWALCERAIALAPRDSEVQAIVSRIFCHDVPNYFFYMLGDAERNRIYEEALRRAIRPGVRVLDIGSGTGLFAMMAARAGAAEVITCEANPAIATVVSEVVAQNGLAGRVRVVAKHSSDLEVGVDLDGPADVLVFDNISNNLIADGVLSSIEQAARWLIRPGATLIPACGTIRVALADDRGAVRWRTQTVQGFDLSHFRRLAPSCYQIMVGDPDLRLRGDPRDLFRFDFQSGGPFPEARAELSLVSSGGHVSGIVQWLRLDIDGQSQYESKPKEGTTSVWNAVFHPLMRPIDMAPGERLKICASHDRLIIYLWAPEVG